MLWVVVTGGGSGIGRALVHHLCGRFSVLTCGRRGAALDETVRLAPAPAAVTAVRCDIGSGAGRAALLAALPAGAAVALLVQNAALGDPAPVAELDISHFEEALRVNVVAPLALFQALLPRLRAGGGRVLHLGTSVAHAPQRGTATYGVTKACFHRLFLQLNAENTGVAVGSLSPGLVDTEGVRDHVAKARALALPHVAYFDEAFARGGTSDMAALMTCVDSLLEMSPEAFSAKEHRFSDWRASSLAAAAAAAGSSTGAMVDAAAAKTP